MSELLEKYNPVEKEFLISGFAEGFKIPCEPFKYKYQHYNHKSATDNPSIVDEIVLKEIKLGRVLGPFKQPPFDNLQTSPLGLVPKSDNSYRLIHDLSYPFDNSVNSNILPQHKSVSYQSLSESIDQILHYGQGTLIAKADIESAYRIVPIHLTSFHLLGLSWRNHYFVDIMLPFGLAVSCKFFDCFSRALVWILLCILHVLSLTFILDDFVFLDHNIHPSARPPLAPSTHSRH